MIWKKITAMKQQFIPIIPSSIGSDWSISSMKINLWYCKDMQQWRWTLTDDSRPIVKQESGQQPFLRDAMNDVANTVEYMMDCKQPE
jgi:hypothetical protein